MDTMDHMDAFIIFAVMQKSPFCPSGPPGPLNADVWQKTNFKREIIMNFCHKSLKRRKKVFLLPPASLEMLTAVYGENGAGDGVAFKQKDD